MRRPFSRSYGAILPSSLTKVLSRALEFSSRLPVSVCGTGTIYLARGFSWQCGINYFASLEAPGHTLELMIVRIYLDYPPKCFDLANRCQASISSCVTPLLIAVRRWHRNFNRFSIAYAFRPRLRSRLTLSGRAFLRKP